MADWKVVSHFDIQPPVRNDAHFVVATPVGDSFQGVKCVGMRQSFRTAPGAYSLLRAVARTNPAFQMRILKIMGTSVELVSLPNGVDRYDPPYADMGSW